MNSFQGLLRSSTMAARKAASAETMPEFRICPSDGAPCVWECRGPLPEDQGEMIPVCARWNFTSVCEHNPTPPA